MINKHQGRFRQCELNRTPRAFWGALSLGVAIWACPSTGQPNTDPCALVSPGTIQKIFGEAANDAKPTSEVKGNLRFSECFYTLPTFTNSISVSLTSPSSAQAHVDAAREMWQRWFHKAEDKEREKQTGAGRESEEEEAAGKATPVSGIGDEAFWVHSFVGNLYVRKGGEFTRISIGGKLTDEQRLVKAKALAADVLRQMPSDR